MKPMNITTEEHHSITRRDVNQITPSIIYSVPVHVKPK